MATLAVEESESASGYREPLAEPINPMKLVGYFNDVIRSLLEESNADILKDADKDLSYQSPKLNSTALLKACTTFASDSSPAVLFILRDSCYETLTNERDESEVIKSPGMIQFCHFFVQFANSFIS